MNKIKQTILIVDDEPTNLAVLNMLLSKDYTILAANSGIRALEIAVTQPPPDLMLLDIMMAGMNGYTVLKELKKNPVTQDIPVIFITAMQSQEDETKGFQLGAVDYISKPINPVVMQARVKTQLVLKRTQDFLRDKNVFLEAEISLHVKENEVIQNVCIRALAHLAETRDPETGEHILRTQAYVHVLAKQLQNNPRFKATLTENYIELLTKSAPLHDIGKVGIPDHILLKPGKLNAEEWRIMKTHAEIGAHSLELAEKDMAQKIEFLTLAKQIAHYHHERWDGGGYPDGLAGDDIPLAARFMALADVFDALISKRVYKPAMSYEYARDYIIAERNQHFDPDITDVFSKNFNEFVLIARKFQTSD
nr:two-component system response regulator [Rhodospirillales bacterium]